MKKLIIAMLAIGSIFTATAQTKTTFGVKGGVNFAKVYASADNTSETANSGGITSFHAGVFADAPIGQGFSIQPALYYSGKGFDSNDGINTGKLKLNYLQLPVNVVYNVPVSSGKFFFGAGPYAAYGISGKVQDQISGRSVSVDVNFGNDAGSDVKRMDYGITGLVGFQFTNRLLLSANYDLGLSNIMPGDNLGYSVKNKVAGISLGFTF
jgi:hypothetical protein